MYPEFQEDVDQYMNLFEKSCHNISFFSKFLLRPIEIAFKKDNKGLFQVVRENSSADKKTLIPIQHPDIQSDLQALHKLRNTPACQDLLAPDQKIEQERRILYNKSLLHMYTATKQRNIKVAICVCAYSEQQEMLKRTLSGINANYRSFLKQGVSPEQIAVVFIFDGIEKVSSSIEVFFDHMDEESNFKWKNYGKTISEMLQEETFFDEDNINIYSKEQLKVLEGKLFAEQRKEYFRTKDLQRKIGELKGRKGLMYENLPYEVQQEYVRALRIEHQNIVFSLNPGEQKISSEEILTFFKAHEYEKVRQKCIAIALTEVETLTTKYFQSREDTALLYSYRYEMGNNAETTGNNIQASEQDPLNNALNEPTANATSPSNHSDVGLAYGFRDSNPNTNNNISLKRLKPYIFLCVKYTNSGKLSSQNWFFQGFCEQFKCDVAILLDVGLKPDEFALFKFYKHLKDNTDCGGVCGYMGLAIQRPFNDLGYYQQSKRLDCLSRFSEWFFDIQKAQRFEYHFAHMLDKPFQAFFGFINVLPGAFSAYNMKRLFQKNSILDEYFKSLNNTKEEVVFPTQTISSLLLSTLLPRAWVQKLFDRTPKESANKKTPYEAMKYKNVCLAEDRILCLGIHQQNMTMAFLPDAWATVDSVTSLQSLLAQRRRWINGSYFAFEEVTDKSQICCSNFWYCIEMSFYLLNSCWSYISIALFYITLDMTANTFSENVVIPLLMKFYNVQSKDSLKNCSLIGMNALAVANGIPHIISFCYVAMVGSMIFLSLNLNQVNKHFERVYHKVCSLMGWYSILMYIMLAYSLFGNTPILNVSSSGGLVTSDTLKLIVQIILGIQAIPPVFFFLFVRREFKFLWEVITSAPSYIFYAASYLHILNIYAICRVDDLSWGTKGLTSGDNQAEKSKLKEAWEAEKFIFVSRFLVWNILAGIAFKILTGYSDIKSIMILILSGLIGLSLVFRLFFAIIYLSKYQVVALKNSAHPITSPLSYLDEIYKKYETHLIRETVMTRRGYIQTQLNITFNIVNKMLQPFVKKATLKRGNSKLLNKLKSINRANSRLDTLTIKITDSDGFQNKELKDSGDIQQPRETAVDSVLNPILNLLNIGGGSSGGQGARRPSSRRRLAPLDIPKEKAVNQFTSLATETPKSEARGGFFSSSKSNDKENSLRRQGGGNFLEVQLDVETEGRGASCSLFESI